MTAGALSRLVRDTRDIGEATFLELFFDLAFVFAISRVSQAFFEHLGWRGTIDTTEVVCALFWTWLTSVWLTEALDADHLVVQTLIVVLMFGALVFAASVGEAYTGRSVLFAAIFVGRQLVRDVFLLLVSRHSPLRARTVGALGWAVLSAPLWLAGGFAPRAPQEILWAAAIIVDYAGAAAGWPLPGRGRTHPHHVRVPAGHLSERCRQFIIIALGEMILTITARFEERDLTAASWLAFILAFILTVEFWRIYIFRAGELMHHAIAASRRPSLFRHGAAFAHLIMVIGIVYTNVGLRLVIRDPLHSHHAGWTLIRVAGPVVFLIGRSMLEFNVFGRLTRIRLAGTAAILVLYPLVLMLSQIASLAIIDVVLLVIAVADTLRWHHRPVAVRGTGPDTATGPDTVTG